MFVEGNVVKARSVEALPGIVVAQERGIALDIGVEALLFDQIGRDPLDLVRRTSVERGFRDRGGNAWADAPHEALIDLPEAAEVPEQPLPALPEDRRLLRVLHALDVGVDLRGLDPLEIIADGHIEDEALRISEPELPREHLAGEPGLHVLLESLLHSELRRPLAVVALVLRRDAGLRHARGQFPPVHFLDGLQLEETGAAHIGRHDVLSQLGIRARCRAEGALDLLPENRPGLLLCAAHELPNAENTSFFRIFSEDPRHQIPETDLPHDIAHNAPSFLPGTARCTVISTRGDSAVPRAISPAPSSRRSGLPRRSPRIPGLCRGLFR